MKIYYTYSVYIYYLFVYKIWRLIMDQGKFDCKTSIYCRIQCTNINNNYRRHKYLVVRSIRDMNLWIKEFSDNNFLTLNKKLNLSILIKLNY